MTDRIPVTVIGGYLGAGKTTLVNHLLRHAAPRRLAVLVNEFGELPIDADLIEAQEGDVISLSGGCVCCSYGSDLSGALMGMLALDPSPDHIILEASGVALPRAIASSLSLLRGVSLDGVVVMADAETVRERSIEKYMGDTITRQLQSADLVFLNKTDLVSAARLASTRDWLLAVAPQAVVVDTQQAQAPITAVLQCFEREPSTSADSQMAPHDASVFKSFSLSVEQAVEPSQFAKHLIASHAGLVRAKGFVRNLNGEMQTLQVVGKRFEISTAPAGVSAGVVVICFDPKAEHSRSDNTP